MNGMEHARSLIALVGNERRGRLKMVKRKLFPRGLPSQPLGFQGGLSDKIGEDAIPGGEGRRKGGGRAWRCPRRR